MGIATSQEDATRGTLQRAITGLRIVAAIMVVAATVLYLGWLAAQSPREFLQLFLNGVIAGSVYALMAIGFAAMYSTVGFFDISYAAMPVLSGFTVFYFNQKASRFSSEFVVGGLGSATIVGAIVALMTGWILRIWAYPALRARLGIPWSKGLIGVIALAAGLYGAALFLRPDQLQGLFAPVVGVGAAAVVLALASFATRRFHPKRTVPRLLSPVLVVVAIAVGAFSAMALHEAADVNLYLGWVLGIVVSGVMAMLYYGGVYRHLAGKERSPLVPMVGSLGIYLAMVALLSIVFTPNAKSLPVPFGSDAWAIGAAYIKPFSLFFISVVAVFFMGFVLVLKKTTLGKEIRAIADDAELAMTVGINVPAVIMIVFSIGAACGAMAGIYVAEDTAFKPTTGLEMLFKGWVASVVGGLGNIYGAILGGLLLGLLENYGVWYVAAEWKNSMAFGVLVVFMLLWPKGLLPRR